MAISISNITGNAALTQSANLAIAKHGNTATDPFGAANRRVEQQLSSTNVKLSSFSQIQSGFADVQTAARGLSDPGKTGASADVVKAAQQFASAYNTAINSVNSARDARKNGALADDTRALIAGNDLKSIVTSGSNASDLKKIGISRASDGTVSVDVTALQNAMLANPNAVADTLSRIGKQAEKVSAKELAATGNVGGAVGALSNRNKYLETQLSEQKNLAAASQNTVQKQAANFSGSSSAVASYLQTLAL